MEVMPTSLVPALPTGPLSQLLMLQMITQMSRESSHGEDGNKTQLPTILRSRRSTNDAYQLNNAFTELVLENHRLKQKVLEKDEKISALMQLLDSISCPGKASETETARLKEQNPEDVDMLYFSDILKNISITNNNLRLSVSGLRGGISEVANNSSTVIKYIDTIYSSVNLQDNLINYFIRMTDDHLKKTENISYYPQFKCTRKRSVGDNKDDKERKITEEEELLEELKKELDSANKYNDLLYIYYKYEDKLNGLHRACLKCDLADVKLIVKHGGSLNKMDDSEYGNTAVHLAARGNCTSIMEWVLQNSSLIDIKNKIGATPLHVSAKFNHLQMSKLLIDRNANISAKTLDKSTPLHIAAQYGCKQMTELLLNNGADFKVLSKYGTPLHTAVFFKNPNVVEVLLKFGADVNSASMFGSPLHVVSQGGDSKIAEMLVRHGAAVDLFNDEGMTPLHIAAEHDKVEVAQVLLCNGADLEAKTRNMFTALHVAARNGSLRVARFLIDSGAQIDPKSREGLTPLYIAAESGNLLLGRLLLDKGARLSALPHARFSKYLVNLLYAQVSTYI